MEKSPDMFRQDNRFPSHLQIDGDERGWKTAWVEAWGEIARHYKTVEYENLAARRFFLKWSGITIPNEMSAALVTFEALRVTGNLPPVPELALKYIAVTANGLAFWGNLMLLAFHPRCDETAWCSLTLYRHIGAYEIYVTSGQVQGGFGIALNARLTNHKLMPGEIDPLKSVKTFNNILAGTIAEQRRALRNELGRSNAAGTRLTNIQLQRAYAKEINWSLDRLGCGFKFPDDDRIYRLRVSRNNQSDIGSFEFQAGDRHVRWSSVLVPDLASLDLAEVPSSRREMVSSAQRV